VAAVLHRRAAAEARLGMALPRQMGDEVQGALVAALGEHLDGPLRSSGRVAISPATRR
jgi:hypothetical protein